MTWADDGHLYSAWGDGGGFGGSNRSGRVSLGVARIEGPSDSYVGVNLFGGLDAEHPATFPGKSYGILSVEGTLYMWVLVEGFYFHKSRLYASSDRGITWTGVDWMFEGLGGSFSVPSFLNFGRDYRGARDEYVYLYAPDARGVYAWGDGIELARVPRQSMLQQSAYEFFAGLDPAGNPLWVDLANIAQRQNVITDADQGGGRIHWNVRVVYVAGQVNRYVAVYKRASSSSTSIFGASDLIMLDAPEPWGPWTTINVWPNWLQLEDTWSYSIPAKWLDPDGLRFTMVFSGRFRNGGTLNDAWNTIEGLFVLSAPGDSDGDDDVDLADVGAFQRCFGIDRLAATCGAAYLDATASVDLADHRLFVPLMTGPR
ncbi:MAG: hypothetical protein ACE5EX_02940 [Phycisphaerae bacterium]